MPSVTMMSSRLTIQMRKYSLPEPVNSIGMWWACLGGSSRENSPPGARLAPIRLTMPNRLLLSTIAPPDVLERALLVDVRNAGGVPCPDAAGLAEGVVFMR